MCLILAAEGVIGQVDLLLVSNRDERYDRPTSHAHFWPDKPEILGGRDLQGMGTWLGVSRTGELAAVTNIREPKNVRQNAPSRGRLPVEFLESRESVEAFVSRRDLGAYNGFNMVVWDGSCLSILSNRSDEIVRPGVGVHGVSNGLPTSMWPKVEIGMDRMRALLDTQRVSISSILEIMQDEEKLPDNQLPHTGVGRDLERELSSSFIRMHGYGTRCTTVVWLHSNGWVEYDEYTYDRSPHIVKHVHHAFDTRGRSSRMPADLES